jgi:hypothetical protein
VWQYELSSPFIHVHPHLTIASHMLPIIAAEMPIVTGSNIGNME